MTKTIIGDDGDRELLCEHGVGHGHNVHTCDGCCGKPGFFYELDGNITFNDNAKRKALELADLLVRKQRDYGTGNILKTPILPANGGARLGVVQRLNDKVERAANLLQSGNPAANEALTDTFMDIAGYGLILWMLEDGTFELPLAEE